MKKVRQISALLLMAIFLISGCTKDNNVPPGNESILVGKNLLTHHEIELYSGGVLQSKKVEQFSGFYLDLKSDGTYTVNNQEGITSGIWEQLSPNYLVFDKNVSNERYFYILYSDPQSFLLRGPFKKNGELKLNYLTNSYYHK